MKRYTQLCGNDFIRIEAIRSLLRDLTTFTPTSSDLVECLHGFQQAKLHRFRGRKPTDHAAQEIAMLASIQSTHTSSSGSLLEVNFGEKFATRRFPGFDRKGCNQYILTKRSVGKSRFFRLRTGTPTHFTDAKGSQLF